MNVFTKTAKGKIIGLSLVLFQVAVISGIIALIVIGQTVPAIIMTGMIQGGITVGYGAAEYLREQEWKTATGTNQRKRKRVVNA
jgi:hypothetical protein